MAAQELDPPTDCNFPVRSTFWRSSTWVTRSAPPSPKGDSGGSCTGAEPSFQRQSSKARTSLPPLAIARRSLNEWPRGDSKDWNIPPTPGTRRGPDIKLDLGSVNRASLEPTEIQLKRDKFAFFDKECSRVANYHIYLGSDAVAKNREILRVNGITHVLNCVGFVCPEYFKKDFVYKTLWLQDSPWEDITSLLYDVFDYFEEVKELGGRVFVHCCQGVSRSASLVIAYLMWREHLSFEDAFQDVKAARGVTNPNMGFACQLLQCQKRVHATPMSPDSVLRMYRMAPHSPYDPLHLVPKIVNDPGTASLDSRGAFILHVPQAIYVWVGLQCDPKIAHAAKSAANQVIRYENAKGPACVYVEGQEELEFWASLSKHCASSNVVDGKVEQMDSIVLLEKVRMFGVGNRKVAAYDVDFELYQRARQGGIVPPVPSTGAGLSPTPTRIPAREDGWSLLRHKFLSGELFTPKGIDISPQLSPSSASGSYRSSTGSPQSEGIVPFPNRLQTQISFSSQASSLSSPSTFDENSTISVQTDSSPDKSPNYLAFPPQEVPASETDLHCTGCHEDPGFTLNLKPPPPNLSGKSPAVLLAQRRATASHSVLCALEDYPPRAPKGLSRKSRLPPLVRTKDINKANFQDHDMVDIPCEMPSSNYIPGFE